MTMSLIEILKEELARQRTFLSTDEETALSRPISYDNEEDLAFDRVRHRRMVFYTALRARFIRERRPIGRWQQMIDEEEAQVGGEPTVISQVGTQVLSWAARTSDRGAMLGGFVANLVRWLGILLVLIGVFSIFQRASWQVPVILALAAIVCFVIAGAFSRLVAGRVAAATERMRKEHTPAAESAPPSAASSASPAPSTTEPGTTGIARRNGATRV